MKRIIPYTLLIFILTASGCIKNEVIPGPASDGIGSSTLRSLLANNFSFSMFYSAMQRTGVDTLLDGEAYTLLVPDDNAFANSGITPDSLARIDTDTLRELMLYHVLPGTVRNTDVPQAIDFPYETMQKSILYTSVDLSDAPVKDTSLYINGVLVVKPNVMARNGVIHILNRLLTVSVSSVQYILQNNPDYQCLVAGFKKYGIWEKLTDPGPFVILAPTNDAFAAQGWDLQAIENMNAAEYKKLVFGCYVLTPIFFFDIDFKKFAPPPAPLLVEGAFLEYQQFWSDGLSGFKVLPLDYRERDQSEYHPWFGGIFEMDKPNQLSANGIVHQVNAIGVVPDSARIR